VSSKFSDSAAMTFGFAFGFYFRSTRSPYLCFCHVSWIAVVFTALDGRNNFSYFHPKIRHLLVLFVAAIIENFGYRQLTTPLAFLAIGLIFA